MQDQRPYFTDGEVDEMCTGLTQCAAKIRHLRRLGLRVDRKPNGQPLAWKPEKAPNQDGKPSAQEANGVVVGLQSWAAARKGKNGTTTQGR